MSRSDEYAIPKTSRIKLKETPGEQAHKVYRAEQARQARISARVARANDTSHPNPRHTYFSSPPPPSFQPYGHHRQSRQSSEEFDHYPGYRVPEGDSRWSSAYEDGPRIPSRFARQAGYAATATDPYYDEAFGGPSSARGSSHTRRAENEVRLNGGPVPNMGNMSIKEYQAWVREGMDKIRRRDDAVEREQMERERAHLQREREAAIAQEREERERRERKERRRAERAEAERKAGQAESDARRAEYDSKRRRVDIREEADHEASERKRYLSRWKVLGGSGEGGSEIVEVELAFGDIPWPVYRLKGGFGGIDVGMLSLERVGAFLRDLAKDSGAQERRVHMDAMRLFHPDKFFGRILPRVKERDAAAIREGVEACSRVINQLMASRNA